MNGIEKVQMLGRSLRQQGYPVKFIEIEEAGKVFSAGFDEPGQPRKLTPQEQNHVKMHKCLVAIQSSAGWENIDPYTQDEIDAAVREGKQWFGR